MWDNYKEDYFMRRMFACLTSLSVFLLSLPGCNTIGDKSGSLSMIYGITALLSLLMLIGYCCITKKKDPWFVLLFSSVLVVNIGYYALAVSQNLAQALMANRIAYLGSVFLPLSMLMIILSVTGMRPKKWLPIALLALGAVVFLIAASPGYLDIYYKEVFFQKLNGITILEKVYGPLHGIYLIYLLSYFIAMVSSIVYATLRDKVDSIAYAAILAIAVFVNIGVWLIEQLVRIDFEILSVSYIISECFLLGLHLFIAENNRKRLQEPQPVPSETPLPVRAPDPAELAQLELFTAGLSLLTAKEQMLYDCYTAGMSTAEIMEQLNIKENTLKFHNKNLYGKLGVSSRKQLLRLATLKKHQDPENG